MNKKLLRLCINTVESSQDIDEKGIKGEYFIAIMENNNSGKKVNFNRTIEENKIKSYDLIKGYLDEVCKDLDDGKYFVILENNIEYENIIDFNYYSDATVIDNKINYFNSRNFVDKISDITDIMAFVDNINVSRSYFDNGFYHFVDIKINGKKYLIKFKSNELMISYNEVLYNLSNLLKKELDGKYKLNLLVSDNLKDLIYNNEYVFIEVEDHNIKFINFQKDLN